MHSLYLIMVKWNIKFIILIEICVSVSDCTYLSFYFTALLIMLRLQPIDLDFKVLNSVQTRRRCQEQDL